MANARTSRKVRPEMRCRNRLSGISWVVLGAAMLLVAAPSPAQETPATKAKPWYQSIDVRLFVESSYTYNFGRPDSSTNQFRVFDTKADTVRFDVAEVVIRKDASSRGEAGFRIDALAGSSIPQVTAASGLFRDDVTGKAGDFDILQAFASWVAPIGRGLKLDAGKFTTHMGYEVVDGPDGYNDNASRSLLFGWTVPISHTGLRMTYPVTDRFSVQALVVAGWDNVTDDNGARSVGAQLLYTPVPDVVMALNTISGPEKPGNDADQRNSFDYWVTWNVGRVSLAMNADYGNEEGDATGGRRVDWYGLAGYVHVTVNERFAITMRGETFCDPDGERTGTSQTIREVTFTPAYKLRKGLVLRGDLRHDWSDEPVFEHHDGPSTGQTTASLNIIYSL